MNRMNPFLSPKTAADLQTLLEPIGDFIAAVGTIDQQKAAVLMALIILTKNVHQVNDAADAFLETSSTSTPADSRAARGLTAVEVLAMSPAELLILQNHHSV